MINIKNGKNPILKQIAIIQKNNLNPDQWLVIKSLPDKLSCVNRIDGKLKDAYLKVSKI